LANYLEPDDLFRDAEEDCSTARRESAEEHDIKSPESAPDSAPDSAPEGDEEDARDESEENDDCEGGLGSDVMRALSADATITALGLGSRDYQVCLFIIIRL
jgi:hypothetical protein